MEEVLTFSANLAGRWQHHIIQRAEFGSTGRFCLLNLETNYQGGIHSWTVGKEFSGSVRVCFNNIKVNNLILCILCSLSFSGENFG